MSRELYNFMRVSVIQPISNAISLGYAFIEAILSILPIVDEVLINDGGSSDETSFYLKKLRKTFPNKIKLFNKPYHPSGLWETIDECVEFLISQAKGDWIFEVQGDEIWHEKDIFKVKQTIENASEQGYNSIRIIVHRTDFQSIGSYKYRNVRMVRKSENLKSYEGGDSFHIGRHDDPAKGFTSSNVPPELVTNIVYFNLSGMVFPENGLMRAKTIATFFAREDKERQEAWKRLESYSFQKQEPDPPTVKQLPALIQGMAGLDKYKVRDELFDKKFLKKLTGIDYK